LTHSYILEGPGGVDDGLDLSILVHGEDVVDDVLYVDRAVLLVQQVTQVEAGEGLVLVEELDRRDFVDLPPLIEREIVISDKKFHENKLKTYRASNAEEALGFAGDDVR
jgi:hypothetical protein